jgi:hypothetical protein
MYILILLLVVKVFDLHINLKYMGSDITGVKKINPSFGDGNDGNATISSPTTLTRNMFYARLDISSTLATANYIVCARNGIYGNGTISNNGTNASGSSGGPAVTGGYFGSTNQSGGNGGTNAVGSNGQGGTTHGGGIGGAGGAGGANAGGASGAASIGGGLGGTLSRHLADLISGVQATTRINGGGGGGGGGSNNILATGGGGGAGAGNLVICTPYIEPTITLSCNGGNGGNGSGSAGSAGGGGGGGGGRVGIMTESTPGCTINNNGGSGGAGYNGGAAGTNGSPGVIIKLRETL